MFAAWWDRRFRLSIRESERSPVLPSFGCRCEAAIEIGSAGGVAGEFGGVVEGAPGLGEDLAGVALGPGVLAGFGDLERGLRVVTGGSGVAAGKGNVGAENQRIGMD